MERTDSNILDLWNPILWTWTNTQLSVSDIGFGGPLAIGIPLSKVLGLA